MTFDPITLPIIATQYQIIATLAKTEADSLPIPAHTFMTSVINITQVSIVIDGSVGSTENSRGYNVCNHNYLKFEIIKYTVVAINITPVL